jgi:hypothetical protein
MECENLVLEARAMQGRWLENFKRMVARSLTALSTQETGDIQANQM